MGDNTGNAGKASEAIRRRIEAVRERGGNPNETSLYVGLSRFSLVNLQRELSQGTDVGRTLVSKLERAAVMMDISLEEFLARGLWI